MQLAEFELVLVLYVFYIIGFVVCVSFQDLYRIWTLMVFFVKVEGLEFGLGQKMQRFNLLENSGTLKPVVKQNFVGKGIVKNFQTLKPKAGRGFEVTGAVKNFKIPPLKSLGGTFEDPQSRSFQRHSRNLSSWSFVHIFFPLNKFWVLTGWSVWKSILNDVRFVVCIILCGISQKSKLMGIIQILKKFVKIEQNLQVFNTIESFRASTSKSLDSVPLNPHF